MIAQPQCNALQQTLALASGCRTVTLSAANHTLPMTPTITLPAGQRDSEGFTPYIATFKINTLDDAAEFYCGIADGWGAMSATLKSIAFANQLATTPPSCPSPAPPSETPCLLPAQMGQLSTLPCQAY